MPKFHMVRRIEKMTDGSMVDNGSVDIPDRDLAETLANHPFWFVAKNEVMEPQAAQDIGYSCPLCGKECKDAESLLTHKKKH